MALNQNIEIELVEKEIITIEMYVIDRIAGATGGSFSGLTDTLISNPVDGQVPVYDAGVWKNQDIVTTADPTNFVQGEVPTPAPPVLSSEKFTTANNFATGTLEVFLNGMKLLPSDFTIYGSNQFSVIIDVIVGDNVNVNYIKT